MKNQITIGIQGGRGSFNEEAILMYVKHNKIPKTQIKYLHTTENVLKALEEEEIDQGQFAIHNTLGGIVHESIRAMGRYHYELVTDYQLKIEHALMIHKDSRIKDIDTIMAHPQVFAQCKETLKSKYPNLRQIVGEGELIDHAKVAEQLSNGKLGTNIAVMGSAVLAQVYSLQLIENALQDHPNNYTTFLLVKK